ncbi:MAG TPA: hypothetical protein VFC99_01760 [Acidimicrobiia bacterium]|nr:hypothetical protein [Acidimicrobiia bacterium]
MGYRRALVVLVLALTTGLGATTVASTHAGASTRAHRVSAVGEKKKRSKKKAKGKQLTTQPDACTLVTQDDAAAILGEPVERTGAGGVDCNYLGSTSHLGAVTVVARLLQGSGNVKFAKQQLAQLAGAKPVKGIGDAAVEVLAPGGPGEIEAVARNVEFHLTVRKATPGNAPQVADLDAGAFEALARKAIARL